MECKKRLIELSDKIREAEEKGRDTSKLITEKNKIKAYLKEVKFKNIPKEFTDDATKISNKVNRAIDRAIKKLRFHSDQAYNHFSQAFKPINSLNKKYKPTEKLPWKLG